MTAGGRRFFAALAILMLPVGAAAQIPSSELPGRERQRFVDPQAPRAQPGGDTISLPSTVAPPGAERITLTISRVVVTGATVYSDADLAPLYADMMGAEVPLAAVYDLARRITAKYGAAGYVLSRAIVPPQNFGRHGAVVRIQVVEGYVDQVIWPVEKLTRYRDFFTDYSARITADRPANVRTLERYLLLANDLPGLKFSTTLKPSPTHPNASILIVEVKEKMIDTIARIDNRGTPARGPWQYLGSATFNNIAGSHEAFTATYAGTFQLEELQYIQATYRQVLNSEGLTFFANASYGIGTPGTALLRSFDYRTRSSVVEAGLTYPVIRTRELNLLLTGLGFITDDFSSQLGQPFTHDKLRGFRFKGDADWADSWLGINQVNVTFSQGIKGLGSTRQRGSGRAAAAGRRPDPVDQCGPRRLQQDRGNGKPAAAAAAGPLGLHRGLRPIRVHAAAGVGAMLVWRALLRPRLRSLAAARRPLLGRARRVALRHHDAVEAAHAPADLRVRGSRRGLQHPAGGGHAAVAERLVGRRRRARRVGRHLHGRRLGRQGGRRTA